MNHFIFDAETDGLYGSTLSICAKVYSENLKEVMDCFYGAVHCIADEITEPWVRENVFPYLQNAGSMYRSESELLEAFWQFWLSHRQDCWCIADVPIPVESNVFRKCVEMNREERCFLAPFPLMDLSSMLYCKGMDPQEERQKLAEMEIPLHDPENDVLLCAEILRRILQ